jgi:hypothetical protein
MTWIAALNRRLISSLNEAPVLPSRSLLSPILQK